MAAPRSRWTSFVADPGEERPPILHEEGNPAHRLRVAQGRRQRDAASEAYSRLHGDG